MAADTGQKRARRPRWQRLLIFGIPVLIILFVGGPFVYIHFFDGNAPAPLKVTASSDGSSTAVPVDGNWKATSTSVAGYRVKEVLFGQNTEAVGRTSDLTGSMSVSGSTVETATFTVQMASVKSDKSQRDSQFRGRIMDVSKYPTSTFTLTKPIALGTVPAPGKTVTVDGTGTLTLHGTTKTVTVPFTAARSASTVTVGGTIPVKFSDYGVANPSLGPVQTKDNGVVEFKIVFEKA